MKKIAVLGIGNILMQDDGVGVEVATRLMVEEWPSNVEFIDAGTAILSLLGVFTDCDTIIVVDALRGGHGPGTIYRLTPEQLAGLQKDALSLHDIHVLDMIKMAALFNRQPQVIIYGIEPFRLAMELGITKQMQERLPVLLDYVRQELVGLLKG